MLEYEKKILLTRDEYATLAERFGCILVESQINQYYDTEGFYMNSRGITCRIRDKNGKYKVTIKNHVAAHLNCSMEVNLYEGIDFNSEAFEALGLHLQGELITTRIIIHKDKFCEVVLDRNKYLGRTDYELEVEYAEMCEEKALKYIEEVAKYLLEGNLIDSAESFMQRIGKGKSKSERFFEIKKLMAKP